MVFASQKAEDPNASTNSTVGSKKQKSSSIFVAVDQIGKLAIRGSSPSTSSLNKHSTSAQNLPSTTKDKEKPGKLSFLRNTRKLFSGGKSSSSSGKAGNSSKPGVEIRALSPSFKQKSLEELLAGNEGDGSPSALKERDGVGLGFQTKSVSEVNLREISPVKVDRGSVGRLDENVDDEEGEEDACEESLVSVQEAVAAIESLGRPTTPTIKAPRSCSKPPLKMGNSCSYTLKHNLPNGVNGGKELNEGIPDDNIQKV